MIQVIGPDERPRSDRTVDNVKIVDGLTRDAFITREKVDMELEFRRERGLASAGGAEPYAEMQRYLNAVADCHPAEFKVASELSQQTPPWPGVPELVVAIPIAGFGNQEQPSIVHTLEQLSRDSLIAAGRARIVIFANRPPTKCPDNVGEIIRSACARLNISDQVDFVEGEVGFEMGRKESPLLDSAAAIQRSKPPMGLIRDLITLTTMLKVQPLMGAGSNPVMLQMDADFEGFRQGNLSAVLERFKRYPGVDFLQCASDWESRSTPTSHDPLFKLGCDLMREIPMGIKAIVADPSVSETMVQQALFGELIQRGIQVPQAETIGSLARKGGYGLLRLSDDELDANVRCAYRPHSANIDVANDIVFLWDSRRALAAWAKGVPPISQWKSAGFCDTDPVRTDCVMSYGALAGRTEDRIIGELIPLTDEVLRVVNETLKRIPIPANLSTECQQSGEAYIRAAIARCGITSTEAILERRREFGSENEIFQLTRGAGW